MAASNSRDPHNIPLPPSPAAPIKPTKQSSRKGKGKEDAGSSKRRVGQQSTKEGTREGEGAESPWDWVSLTDSVASSSPPIFTKDGSYFFSLLGTSVKIYSVATGQIVSTLTPPPAASPRGRDVSQGRITSATLNPHNAFQLITASLNGHIMVWDYLEAALLQTIDIAQPIHHICAHEKFKDCVFVAASRPSNKKKDKDDNAVVLQVSLKPSEATLDLPVRKSSEITPIGKTRFAVGLGFSPSGAWLVAIAGHKAYVAMTSSLNSGFTKYVSPERLTSLAFHPSEEYFATGDDKGVIRLWYCLNDRVAVNTVGVEKKAQTTTLHWHAHAISSLTFTSNGAYLLSGGEESVLVVWQLETGKKEFVPRVGAPIKTVVLSKVGDGEEEYLLGLSDATYVFVSAATLKVSRSYSRIKIDPSIPHDWPSTSTSPHTSAPLAVHSLTSTLILPSSHPSSLQTYSPSSSKLISELEVSPSNRVSRRDEKPVEPARVEQSIISSSGEWMATVDCRDGDESFRGEIYLKIWWWDRKAGFWILNTRIDRPHGLKRVSSVSFSPSKDRQLLQLVTTGDDGHIKTWRIRSTKDKAGEIEEFWVTRSSFSLRSETPTHASWSPDGSLLAVTLGPSVALYDPVTNILRQTLSSPECSFAHSAHFIGRGGRYLAIAGSQDMVLWDLVAQCVRWNYKSTLIIDTIAPHPRNDTFALFHQPSPENQQTKVFIFDPSSPSPSRIHTVPFGLRNISWYPFSSPTDNSSFTLVAITQSWSVVLVGDEAQLPEEEGSSAREISEGAGPAKRTLFQDIFGKSAFADLSNEPVISVSPGAAKSRSGQEFASIFDGPAYLMPPLETLFKPLIDSFLKIRPDESNVPAEPGNGTGDDEDVDMEDEIRDTVTVSSREKRVVDKAEIDVMVELFKKHSVIPIPVTSNHVGKAHSASKAKTNGTTPHAASPAALALKHNSSTPRPKNPAPHPTPMDVTPIPMTQPPSVTITNGKKRKKSLS